MKLSPTVGAGQQPGNHYISTLEKGAEDRAGFSPSARAVTEKPGVRTGMPRMVTEEDWGHQYGFRVGLL